MGVAAFIQDSATLRIEVWRASSEYPIAAGTEAIEASQKRSTRCMHLKCNAISVGALPRGAEGECSMTIERRRGMAFRVLVHHPRALIVAIASSAVADSNSPVPAVNTAEGIVRSQGL